ncbi:MAG: GNAT family N-acetyltransferase [Planctomycetota bacterium]|jgi:ribosomal protein S18 acetylase RimI-like enzyme
MSIQLRPAQPTQADGVAFARYIDQAAEGFMRFLLGAGAEDVIARAFLVAGHDLSHEHATFAERDGVVVGMATGYTAKQHGQSSDSVLREAAGWRRFRMYAVAIVAWRLLRLLDSLPDSDYYLMAVAVDDACRGAGIGSLLIDHIEERARASGARRLALDVAVKNAGARRLYERRGFVEEARSPGVLFLPGSSLIRMVKPLAAPVSAPGG